MAPLPTKGDRKTGSANNSAVSVIDLLLAANAKSLNGLLFDVDHSNAIDAAERQEINRQNSRETRQKSDL